MHALRLSQLASVSQDASSAKAAVLPPPLLQADGSGRPGWDATLMFEQKQQRALVAILGDSAGGVLSHQTILVVFGL